MSCKATTGDQSNRERGFKASLHINDDLTVDAFVHHEDSNGPPLKVPRSEEELDAFYPPSPQESIRSEPMP